MSRKIYITDTDKEKLQKLIEDAILDDIENREHLKDLIAELDRAEVVGTDDLPYGIITMNSKVLLVLDEYEEEIALVYPRDADVVNNRISVLSPIGTAILGYREGDIVEWKVPSGITKIEIKKVLYQPEASGNIS